MAEDPEEGATLAELESSFLSPFDPETESLEEYEVRRHQGVEMARLQGRSHFPCRVLSRRSAIPDSLYAVHHAVPHYASSCTPGRP